MFLIVIIKFTCIMTSELHKDSKSSPNTDTFSKFACKHHEAILSMRFTKTWTSHYKKRRLTILSGSELETRWNACKECGNSRGATGSQEPSFGARILMMICQLMK